MNARTLLHPRQVLQALRRLWQRHRADQTETAGRWLKARYHIFRILLADNERALLGMAELDRLLQEQDPARLQATAEDLVEIILEMIDGLNRLTGSAYPGLYLRLDAVRRQLDAALERYHHAPAGRWLPLEQLTAAQREQAGGKALPLALLRRVGLPVPAAAVVTRQACREYLRAARLDARLTASLEQAFMHQGQLRRAEGGEGPDGAALAALAAKAQAMIRASSPAPGFAAALRELWDWLRQQQQGEAAPLLAVRSSAVSEDGAEHSFAGQYASVLGVGSPEALVEAFKTVLASAFSERALAYGLAANAQGGTSGRDPLDMAVLCQRMISPRTAGVLFTRDPLDSASGRMLVTAVPGLGELAVSGRAPADVFRPAREPGAEAIESTPAELARKTLRLVLDHAGGTRLEHIAPEDAAATAPLLSPAELAALRDHALRIEALGDGPQDIEWAIDESGAIWILQARPARPARPARLTNLTNLTNLANLAKLAKRSRPASSTSAAMPVEASALPLLQGGAPASPGKGVGRLVVVRSAAELTRAAQAPRPVVLALHQSLVDAASLIPDTAAVLVDLGNPLDHLACVARERGIPMLTGLGAATTALPAALRQAGAGDWVLVDAGEGVVYPAKASLWESMPAAPRPVTAEDATDGEASGRIASGSLRAVRELALTLHLTDAYGPTFSILECRSLHDLVRFVHEKAVLALFHTGDAITEDVFHLVHRLQDDIGLQFFIIDLGGGLAPESGREIRQDQLRSEPLAALCQGMATPGLRWRGPPPILGVSGLLNRSLVDAGGERPLGNPNYALISRDYLNLNARVDYHFVMIDAVCGANPRENAVRFRFKGGGTTAVQRVRRARCVERILREEGFYATRQEDMITGQFGEGPREMVREKLALLGRLLGFTRLLDAVMIDDAMPDRVAEAFLQQDYALERLATALQQGERG